METLKPVNRIALVANLDKEEVRGSVPEVERIIRSNKVVSYGGVVAVNAMLSIMRKPPDYIVVLGGDGTMLAVARHLEEYQIPLIGVNFGKLGFLTAFTVKELESEFPKILAGKAHISERLMLKVKCHTKAEPIYCMNDVVVNAGSPHRVIFLKITIDGREIATIGGDGIIVGTPTGSTAYNLSAKGPILWPDVNAIIINPLHPHSLDCPPIVVDASSEITITAEQVNEGTDLVVDGQHTFPFCKGDSFTAMASPEPALIVRNPMYPRWRSLVEKFNWGAPPVYRNGNGLTSD